MIAKARVLGLRASDTRAIADAGRRIIDYLEGGRVTDPEARTARANPGLPPPQEGPSSELDRLARYYESGPDGQSTGRPRGNAAAALGLTGIVDSAALLRGLTGRHPVTGEPLLEAARLVRPHHGTATREPTRGPARTGG